MNVYQSEICWEFWLSTGPCHSEMNPHVHIGSRPILSSIIATSISIARTASTTMYGFDSTSTRLSVELVPDVALSLPTGVIGIGRVGASRRGRRRPSYAP